MHAAAYQFVEAMVEDPRWTRPPGLVVEIGGRNVNGSIRELFTLSPDPECVDHVRSLQRYLSTDIAPGPGVDLVVDGATLTLDEPAAAVVCCEVLEHTPAAEAIIANACRLLMPGGILIVTAAGRGRLPHSAVDGLNLRSGEYYRNVETSDLESWLSACREAAVFYAPDTRDVYGVARK